MKSLLYVVLPITLIVSSHLNASTEKLSPYEYVGYKQQKEMLKLALLKYLKIETTQTPEN